MTTKQAASRLGIGHKRVAYYINHYTASGWKLKATYKFKNGYWRWDIKEKDLIKFNKHFG